MLYSVTDPKVESVFIAYGTADAPVYGFVLSYKTRSSAKANIHAPIYKINHEGISDVLEWREVYHLVPGGVDGGFSVLGQNGDRLELYGVKSKERYNTDRPEQYRTLRIQGLDYGILAKVIETDETTVGAMSNSEVIVSIREQLLAKFAEIGFDSFRAIDCGYYTRRRLSAPGVLMEHMGIGARSVATTSIVPGAALAFRLSDTLLDEYKLQVSTDTGQLEYLDDKDRPVMANIYTWL